MPSAIQLDPALLAAGCWLWTGSTWVRASGDGTGRLNVNIGNSTINVPVNIAASAITVPVSVQNFPGNQQVTPYPNNWSTTSYAASALIKGSAGYVHWFQGVNNNASAQMLLLKNGVSGAAPDFIIMILPAYDSKTFNFFPAAYFSSGIYFYTPAANIRATLAWY